MSRKRRGAAADFNLLTSTSNARENPMKCLLFSLLMLLTGGLIGCDNQGAENGGAGTNTEVESDAGVGTEPVTEDAAEPAGTAGTGTGEDVVEEEPADSLPETTQP
jgi:uncharacterized lipoprotein NlpE involved in copper resistance